MNAAAHSLRSRSGPFGKIRDLLRIIAAIQAIDQPLSSPGGVRAAIQILLDLAEVVGLDAAWIDRLKAILDNEQLLNIVAAIIQFLLARRDAGGDVDALGFRHEAAAQQEPLADAASLEWLADLAQALVFIDALRDQPS